MGRHKEHQYESGDDVDLPVCLIWDIVVEKRCNSYQDEIDDQ